MVIHALRGTAGKLHLADVLLHLPVLPVAAGSTGVLLVLSLAVALAGGGGQKRPAIALESRVRLRLWPGPGFGHGRWVLRRQHGLPAARRVARRARPSLSRRDRWLGPWREYASFAGRAHGWLCPLRVFTHLEQVKLVIAPPQKGKTAAAAGSIIDAPGPVVATSVRTDLIAATAVLRQSLGRIHVFNPEGADGFASTVTWNMIRGCEDMATAARRAASLIEGVRARGLDDATFWQDQASLVLGAYMHAAALAAGTVMDVYRWVLEETTQPLQILDAHPGAARTARQEISSYLALPARTRAGISTTIRSALRFLQDPRIAEILCPQGPGTFDPASFVVSRDTLYLVAADTKHTPVPPVFTALITEITWAARAAGAATGRLDPPLCLELDEAANIAPVPVAAWSTWTAGSGIRLSIYVQAFAQLIERWGEAGAEVIWQACDVKLVYCNSSEDSLSRRIEQACGQVRLRGADEVLRGPDGTRQRRQTWAVEPVLPYAAVRALPAGRAIVIRGGCKPLIVRTEQYWKRRDVRRLLRHGITPQLPAVTPRPVPAPWPELMSLPAVAPADELTARRESRRSLDALLPPAAAAAGGSLGWGTQPWPGTLDGRHARGAEPEDD
jgi:type IV secretion system protein VirD4